MTVEARELYSSSMGPIVSGSRTPFHPAVLEVDEFSVFIVRREPTPENS